MERICKVCGIAIPEGRLKAIPTTRTCTEHSNAERFSAAINSFGTSGDNAYQEIEILRTHEDKESYHKYKSSLGTYK